MSKMNRIVLAVLISLVIVAGAYFSVRGAALHAGTVSGRVYLTAGLMLAQNHTRYQSPISSNSYDAPEKQTKFHNCDFDSGYNTGD